MNSLFSYRPAALFVAISAVFHLITPAFAGLTAFTQILLVIGVLFLVFAWVLAKRLRWLAYLVFILLLINFCFAFAYSFGGTPLPEWLFAAIALSDLGAIVCLFATLWRPRAAAA